MSQSHPVATEHKGKPITGRTVLYWLLGFFGVIFIANGIFIWLALGSFPGVAVESSYKAGQSYNADIAEARAQAQRGWNVEVALQKSGVQDNILRAEMRDKAGAPLVGLQLTATLRHPADAKGDASLTLSEGESGVYTAQAGNLNAGNWLLELEASQNGEPVFKSENRLFIKE